MNAAASVSSISDVLMSFNPGALIGALVGALLGALLLFSVHFFVRYFQRLRRDIAAFNDGAPLVQSPLLQEILAAVKRNFEAKK